MFIADNQLFELNIEQNSKLKLHSDMSLKEMHASFSFI